MDDIRAGHEPQITWECISGAVPALTPISAMRALVSLGPELLDPLGTRDRAQPLQELWEQLLAVSSLPTAQIFPGIVPLVLAQSWMLCPTWECPGRQERTG